MLEKFLGISCSEGCERLLAFTCLKDPDHLLRAARCLKNDRQCSAVQLANTLQEMPRREAEALARLVLEVDQRTTRQRERRE